MLRLVHAARRCVLSCLLAQVQERWLARTRPKPVGKCEVEVVISTFIDATGNLVKNVVTAQRHLCKSAILNHKPAYTQLYTPPKLPQLLARRSQAEEALGPIRLEVGAFDGVAEGGSSGGKVAFFAEAARAPIAGRGW